MAGLDRLLKHVFGSHELRSLVLKVLVVLRQGEKDKPRSAVILPPGLPGEKRLGERSVSVLTFPERTTARERKGARQASAGPLKVRPGAFARRKPPARPVSHRPCRLPPSKRSPLCEGRLLTAIAVNNIIGTPVAAGKGRQTDGSRRREPPDDAEVGMATRSGLWSLDMSRNGKQISRAGQFISLALTAGVLRSRVKPQACRGPFSGPQPPISSPIPNLQSPYPLFSPPGTAIASVQAHSALAKLRACGPLS